LRTVSSNTLCRRAASGDTNAPGFKCPPPGIGKRWWTLEDGDGKNAGMCGKVRIFLKDPIGFGFACKYRVES